MNDKLKNLSDRFSKYAGVGAAIAATPIGYLVSSGENAPLGIFSLLALILINSRSFFSKGAMNDTAHNINMGLLIGVILSSAVTGKLSESFQAVSTELTKEEIQQTTKITKPQLSPWELDFRNI